MHKFWIAAIAAAGIAGIARADNSVTLYGTIDAGFQSLSKDRFGERQTVFQDSPAVSNRFGVRGSIDLNNEWRAIANLEGRYFLNGNGPFAQYGSNGNVVNRLFDRAANIGLEGPLGEFRLGYLTNPVVVAHVAGDIRPAFNSGSGIFGWYRNRQWISSCVDGTCDFSYLQRALSWRSPSFGGFTAAAAYSTGSGNTATDNSGGNNNSGWGLVLGYSGNGFGANAAAEEMHDLTGEKIGRVLLLNGSYASGPFVFKAGTTEFRQFAGGELLRINTGVNPEPFATIPSVDQTNRLHNVGVSYAASPALRLTAAGYTYRRKGDGTQKIDLATVTADYAFNKWVTAYAIASTARNGSNANQSAGFYTLTTTPGSSNTALTIGLRAAFDANFRF